MWGQSPVLPPVSAPAYSTLHPPLEGCDPVPLHDEACGKHTRQTSAVAKPWSGWMFATDREPAPWWEIDLGTSMYLDRIALWIAQCPEGTEIEVAAHAFHTPRGEPPEGCFRARACLDDLPIASDGSRVLWIGADIVAQHVRVQIFGEDGAPVSLLVRGAEILAAPLFADTLVETYARAFTLFADRPAFAARKTPGQGPFEVTHTYREVWVAARRLAAALDEALGPAPPDDRVFLGICTRNRPEWAIADIAASLCGYVIVPLSPDDPDDRLAGILARCPIRAIITDGDGDRLCRLADKSASLGLVIACDPGQGAADPRCVAFVDLVARGADLPKIAMSPRSPRDLHTILFTSGSSGAPKGAMRNHGAFLSMMTSYGVAQPAVHLSFQPLSHVSERMYLPAILVRGGLVGFSRGGAHALSDLAALEPTLLGSVPRLFEIVHEGHRRRLREAIAAAPDEPVEEVEARVLAETRGVFGSRLQGLGVGSAPSSPELLAFLQRCFADIWVSDGYGSTECGTITNAGVITPQVELKLVPVDGISVGAAERGEIWVRTPHVIDGYYGDPEASAASVDAEGFFRTGDLGERTPAGVRVVGRVTNVIKLGQGEFVAVDRIEAELATAPVVDQIFVHPDRSSSMLLAVVVPHAAALAALLGESDAPVAELARHPDAARAILRALAQHGRRAGLSSFELPRAVLVEPEPMTAASGLLTASGKLARPAAIARYAARLDAMDRAAPVALESDSLTARLAAVIGEVVGRAVDPEEPIHEGLALDSLVAAEALSAVAATLGRDVPLGVWFAARTVEDLAERLDRGLLAAQSPIDEGPRRDLELPLDASHDGRAAVRVPFETILLTGATGFLGAHLLESLTRRTSARVVCLVRAPTDEQASSRVREALSRHAIPVPDDARWTAIAGDLAAPGLGLGRARFDALGTEIDAILHAGAHVSWIHPYEALRAPNVLGTREIALLAMTGRPKALHHVSTISTAPPDGDESSILSLEAAESAGGYGLSKWVAEGIVRRAAERGCPVAVYRPSMITGHNVRGIGNPDDYVSRYLRACLAYGRHLAWERERLDMTPVDFVADGIVELMKAEPTGGGTHHLTNLDGSMTYMDLGRSMVRAGFPCSPAGYDDFRRVAVSPPESPLRPLASYFPERGFALRMGPWPARRTREALAKLGVVCPAADDRLIAAYVAALAAGRGDERGG